MADDAHRITRQASVTLIVLTIVAFALVVLAAVVVWAELRTDETWSPLHYENPQTVTSRVSALSGAPAVSIGETVDVTGTKCSDETVAVVSTTSWKPIDPRGSSVETGQGHGADRAEGCVTSRFQNEIPDEIVALVRRQHARGHLAPLWQITGVETPIDEDGNEGSPEVWVTEPFAIVAR